MSGYVVGCDGGGTQTTLEIMDRTGKQLARQSFGPLNLNGTIEACVWQTIQEIFGFLNTIKEGVRDCEGICIGAAGVSNKIAQGKLMDMIQAVGYKGPLYLVGDHETALYGAIGPCEGAVLIAGTGSICFGKSKSGKTARVGGWGNLIDDEGSGYAIGRDILVAIVRAYDGRGEKTMLSQLVFQKLQLDAINQLIQFIYNKNTSKKEIAALAQLLSEALKEKDEVAERIVFKACEELTLLAKPVIQTLGLEHGTLAFMGSVLTNNTVIEHGVRKRLTKQFPNLTCQWAQEDAATGAARIALEKLS